MSDNLSAEDRRRVQRGALMEEFAEVKKNNFKAARLCVGLGIVGAHRFYLGQRRFGALIVLAFLSVVLLVYFFQGHPEYENIALFAIVAFIGFFLFEICCAFLLAAG